MNVVAKTETGRALGDAFAVVRDRLPGEGKIADQRRQAFEAYERSGLPHRRIEDWKYTDLRALMREVLPLAASPDDAALSRARAVVQARAIEGVRRLVLVDGAFASDLSDWQDLEKGLSINPLRLALEAGDEIVATQALASDIANPMVALNGAMATDGVVIDVADGTVLTQPLHIVHVASGTAPASTFTRSLLRLGRDAGVTLVESYLAADGAKAYQTHDGLVIAIGDNARLDHVRLVEDSVDAFNISSATVSLGAHAHFNTFGLTSGGHVSRYQLTVTCSGEGSKVETNGVNLINGKQHADTTLFMDHAVPHCTSREIFRAVVDDRAHSVFQGRIVVRTRRAEDRRQDDDPRAAAVRRRGGRQQARARDLRRRRHLRSRCDHRRARREPAVLHARPRTAREGSAGAPDPGLRRRGDRVHRQRHVARGRNRHRAALASGEGVSMHKAVANGSYDVALVRQDFPALAMQIYGKPLVYLDNAASAQKPNAVLDRMTEAYKSEYANVHRGLHYLANAATEAYEGARGKVAKFINARRSEEIVFTRNVTEAINLVASSWGGVNIKEGDEIVLSIMEHHSNIVPWHFLRERHGAVIKWAPVDDEGNFLIEEFEKLLTPRTKIVAITQMSNALGTLVPVKDVIRLAHARGIPVLVDGAQGAVHLPIDVQDLDCDFYAFTGHKVYGPTGIGALYAKHEHLVAMRPFNGGGEMIREVAKDWVTYGDPPHKFEAGTPPIVEAIGLGAAIDYVNSIGKERIAAHEHELLTYAQERLREINSLRVIGTARNKGPVISFEMKGAHPHDVATVIDRQGIAVRAGTHCVMPLLERFNVTATCRASFGMYNTREEVDHLAQALIKARELFA
ncbi:SufS family cysteine desulfurase [Bradyrhizobium elkanii]